MPLSGRGRRLSALDARGFPQSPIRFRFLRLWMRFPNRWRRHCQPLDPFLNRCKQLPGHRHLRQLKGHVLRAPRHLRPDLDQLLSQGRQALAADALGNGHPSSHQPLPGDVHCPTGHGSPHLPPLVTFSSTLGNSSLNWSMTPRQDAHGGRSVNRLMVPLASLGKQTSQYR